MEAEFSVEIEKAMKYPGPKVLDEGWVHKLALYRDEKSIHPEGEEYSPGGECAFGAEGEGGGFGGGVCADAGN